MKTEKQQAQVHEVLDKFNQGGKEIIDTVNRVDLVDTLSQLDFRHSYIGQVQEFMTTFEQGIESSPTFPKEEIMKFRLALLLEELSELSEACGKNVCSHFSVALLNKSQELHHKTEKSIVSEGNLRDCFDALLDIQYVLSGAVLSFGMQKIFNTGFEEVHRSNMSKACVSIEEAQQTIAKYGESTECYIDNSREHLGIIMVCRKNDKKVLKSINYSPASLESIITPQHGTQNH